MPTKKIEQHKYFWDVPSCRLWYQ